ncbi:uncharacterized protein LOC135806718 [Sycon ciliatum]|uniref:uncharacterized protein LOC135806718 n=1 Tax=Sycon ciliatum TaxID=27933 RepID=UPI0031F6B62C
MCGANASAESCDQLTLADQAEISRLQRENEDLRAMLPSREEMRLMRSQVEDATAMKKSFEGLYVEHKRQLLEMAQEKSGLERQLTEAKEKEQKTQHLLDTECGTSSSLQQQLQLSEESLATAAKENTCLSNAMNDGISEMRALKSQVFELQQQLSVSRHELEASNDAAATQKEHLLEQVGELRLKNENLSESIENYLKR